MTRSVLQRLQQWGSAIVWAVGATMLMYGILVWYPAASPYSFGTSILIGIAAFLGATAGWERQAPPPAIASVEISGTIARDASAIESERVDADAVCDAIYEAMDADAEGLYVYVNSRGGEVVPSEDIRQAIAEFDGPTVALAGDQCASGGYLIASAADTIYAREGSLVGSIGVIGSQVNLHELADDLGINYERFVAGSRKDAGMPLKDPTEADREYLQGLIDAYYDLFIERVADARDLSAATLRETDARVFLGRDAHDQGLVDELGTEEDAWDHLADILGHDPDEDSVPYHEYGPQTNPLAPITGRAQAVAYGFGAGIADRLASLDALDDLTIEFKR